jgi:hypothetical protein
MSAIPSGQVPGAAATFALPVGAALAATVAAEVGVPAGAAGGGDALPSKR